MRLYGAKSGPPNVAALAELQRKQILQDTYLPRFEGLGEEARASLAKSGAVWWEYAKMDRVHSDMIGSGLQQKLKELDLCKTVVRWQPLAMWNAFRATMTHHSTAIEGNRLSLDETKAVIDEFAEEISEAVGRTLRVSVRGTAKIVAMNVPLKDIEEVVNHAAAMEYVRRHLFGKPLSVAGIHGIFRILMPTDKTLARMRDFPTAPNNELIRGAPVHVRGSIALRPYPMEVPAVLAKIIDLHAENEKRFHPVVAATLFMTNFLFVHPYQDGNGRVSRLLLLVLLYNAGYNGCIFPVAERSLFMSLHDPCFVKQEYEPMLSYVIDRVLKFQLAIEEFDARSNPDAELLA
jgi:Fic family protein